MEIDPSILRLPLAGRLPSKLLEREKGAALAFYRRLDFSFERQKFKNFTESNSNQFYRPN
jgi:hypothetical protein